MKTSFVEKKPLVQTGFPKLLRWYDNSVTVLFVDDTHGICVTSEDYHVAGSCQVWTESSSTNWKSVSGKVTFDF